MTTLYEDKERLSRDTVHYRKELVDARGAVDDMNQRVHDQMETIMRQVRRKKEEGRGDMMKDVEKEVVKEVVKEVRGSGEGELLLL